MYFYPRNSMRQFFSVLRGTLALFESFATGNFLRNVCLKTKFETRTSLVSTVHLTYVQTCLRCVNTLALSKDNNSHSDIMCCS